MKRLVYRLAAIAIIGAALSVTTESFLTVTNILNVLRQSSLTFLIASGLTLTVLTAGLDLSVGANVGLSACLAGTVMQSTGSVALGAATGLVFGAGIGILNGLMVTVLRLPPFIATYGMLWTLNGVTYWFMGGDTIHGFPPGFRALGSGYWLGVPVPIYLMAAFLFAAGMMTRLRTLQAAPAMQLPLFLILMTAPVYVPRNLLQGWISSVATVNPMTAIVESGGKLFSATREVKVTVGGCGG